MTDWNGEYHSAIGITFHYRHFPLMSIAGEVPSGIKATSNGKTSLVHYRTLSFFAFRLKKKRKFAFFRDFKYKITIEPVRFTSIL